MRHPSIVCVGLLLSALGCDSPADKPTPPAGSGTTAAAAASVSGSVKATAKKPAADFKVKANAFGDKQILRYQIPDFSELSLQQKTLLYYLSQAGHAGRDIIYDQNYKHNLAIRRTLEAVYQGYKGDRKSKPFKAVETYLQEVWFAHGIHHHYAQDKFAPDFKQADFEQMVRSIDKKLLPLDKDAKGDAVDELLSRISKPMFDPTVDAVHVNKAKGADRLSDSATNFYDGVSEKEARDFYAKKIDKTDKQPVSWGLNSQLQKKNGALVERVWKVGGMYGPAIEKIVFWLKKAVPFAENDKQKKALELLVEFYETGDLKKFDAYNIAWVADTDSRIDLTNGFIEVYGDPIAFRGSYESVLSVRDLSRTKRIATIGGAAQWFEDNSPIMDAHKKEKVVGISAKVITVVGEEGDAAPSTPIGINLPNANWIRTEHGSKSVFLGNIVDAYQEARKTSGTLKEFAASDEEVARSKTHGPQSYTLKVDMHEVIGHASGKINEGVGTPKETLKSYGSTLEEARADLVALYYLMDPKLIDLGVMKSLDVGKAGYDGYIRNGLLVQLARIKTGKSIEEAHMRNRALICRWAMEKGKADKVIEQYKKDGKTYFVIRDYEKLRKLFGELLKEIQRIKSEGDYDAGKALVESYGVEVDPVLHKEVKDRYAKLGVKPYSGFIQPRLVPKKEGDKIVDVTVEYPSDFVAQMMRYSKEYSHLPTFNN